MKHFLPKLGLTVLMVICLLVPITGCSKQRNIQQWDAPPDMQIDTTKTYFAVFETSLGTFKVELWAADAPQAVNNFVFLARQHFYDGTVFHRILQYFMIQGGDPDHNDLSINGPGYTIPDELPPKGNYDPGVIAMANSGANTSGSQFFICTGPNAAGLNDGYSYTQFGKVVEGWEVVLSIAAVDVKYYWVEGMGRGEYSRPKTFPVIKHITIEEV